MLPVLGRTARPQSDKDGNEPDRIDRDEKRNKGEEKFLEIRVHQDAFRMVCALW